MIKKVAFLFTLFLCIQFSAQEPIHYTTKQGLPSNHIYDIAEDADGFMWFATNRGLVKYDGETFKTLTIKDGLPNNDTWLLETDLQGRLWYFSKSNYQGYIKNDSIYKFPVINNKVISPRFIHKSKETLWMHSASGIQTVINDTIKGVGMFKKDNWGKTYYSRVEELVNNYVSYNNKDDLFFHDIGTNEHGILKEDRILFFDSDFKLIKKINIETSIDRKNNKIDNVGLLYNQIYFYAMDRGILFIDFKTKTTKYFSFKELINVSSVKYFRAKSLADEIQVSIPGHLLIFDYDLELKERHPFEEKLGRTSHKDSKGNIWLADFTNGISLFPNTQVRTNYYLKSKKVQKINKIDSVFYAGVNDEGFYKYDSTLNTFKSFLKLERTNGEVYQIKKEGLGNIFFISSANSYIKKEKRIEKIIIKNAFTHLSSALFKNLIQFKNNNYYTSGGYIIAAEKHSNSFKYTIDKEGLIHSTIFKDKLYFGGTDGLHIKEKDTLVRPKSNNKLLQVSISNFLSTKEYIYLGTDGRGVYVYNSKEVIHLKNTDGYSIQKIINKGDVLWIATNKGIHQISLNKNDLSNSKIINSFYESDGLLQNNTNDIYLEGNQLFAASDSGIAQININDTIYKQKPKLYFKTKKDTLSFAKESRNNISITYALQDFTNQEYVKYQYRLLPSQKKWTTAQTKILNFANLSLDEYTLEVKAIDQHFNETTIKQYLNVKPTWWQTTIARIGFGLFGLLFFLGFVNILKKRIQQKEKDKADLDKKIAGLELQALRSQMNPHFVHNSLNAIQYYIQRNEVEQSENYLVKFSKLVRLFFENSRKQNISIKDEVTLLNNYLEIEKLRFEDKLSYIIEVDKNIDAEEQLIPSMMLQPIIENAVNHGLFHKKENGLVSITFNQIKEGLFEVIVEDDGIGINKSKEMYNSSSKNYQSKSSAVLEERLELLKQSNEWKIKYTIQDLSEINNTTGTRVSLIFNQSMQ